MLREGHEGKSFVKFFPFFPFVYSLALPARASVVSFVFRLFPVIYGRAFFLALARHLSRRGIVVGGVEAGAEKTPILPISAVWR